MLESLRSLGVSIVVDDFGRGYSSLAYLTRFPIDKLKIDRSFVQEISTAENAAIVDAIIVMAHALGMTVVAEASRRPSRSVTCASGAATRCRATCTAPAYRPARWRW